MAPPLLGLVGDADEALGEIGDDLLARQRRAAALDHRAFTVDLVGAVEADRQRGHVAGFQNADAAADQTRGAGGAARDSPRDADRERAEHVDEVVDCRAGADADHRTGGHVDERGLGHLALQFVLRHVRFPFAGSPTMSAATTQASNCSASSQPEASAASRSVLPLRCASFAILAALS